MRSMVVHQKPQQKMTILKPEQTQGMRRVTQVDLRKTKASKVSIYSTLQSDIYLKLISPDQYQTLTLWTLQQISS